MSKKLLVVDDSETERFFISELAKKIEDVEIDDAAGFSETKVKLSEKKYDLILIDSYMLEGTGAELRRIILEENPGGNAETGAIVMGHESDFEDGYLKENGFINYLEKPIEYNMLKAAISLYT